MPVLDIAQKGLPLGSSLGSVKPGSVHPQVFSLTLTDSVIEDMIKCVRNGKTIQLSLGNDPKITYDSETQQLSSTEDPFYTEYYRTSLGKSQTTSTSSPDELPTLDMPPTSFWAFGAKKRFVPKIRTVPRSSLGVNASTKAASKQQATDTASKSTSKTMNSEFSASAGTDAALEALKNSLASEDARKRENTTKQVKNTAALPPAVQQKGSAKPSNKNRFLAQNKKSLGSNTTRSMPTSPALSGVNSPSLAPTSASLSQQQADKTKAIRRPIIHKLAIGPATEEVINKYKQAGTANAEFKTALEKVAEFDNGKWTLKQRSFRELDVFNYEEYSPEERQTAIDNAVRAYDKLRLGASEPEWERLLPEEERGMGKILSKLQAKIATGPIKPAKVPKVKLTSADDSGRDTGVEDNDKDDLFGEKTSVAPQSTEMTRSHSNPPVTKSKKVSEKEAQAKRLLSKSGKAQTGRVTKSAAVKPDKKTQEKGFKSSKFVNDSDEEDDYLVSNPSPQAAHATAKTNGVRKPLQKPATKKPAPDESEVKPAPVNNKPKGNNTSPVKSSPLAATPPTNASDIEDSSSSSVPTTLKRKVDSQSSSGASSSIPLAKRHQKSGSSSSSSDNSSITSSNGVGSGNRRSIGKDWAERTKIHLLTQKYNAYYPKYRELYREMDREDGPKDPEKMADLFEMQQRLQSWKDEILKAHGITM